MKTLAEQINDLNNLISQGNALEGLLHLVEAEDTYRRAAEIHRELGQGSLAINPQANLARISLARGDIAAAHRQIGEILDFLGFFAGLGDAFAELLFFLGGEERVAGDLPQIERQGIGFANGLGFLDGMGQRHEFRRFRRLNLRNFRILGLFAHSAP